MEAHGEFKRSVMRAPRLQANVKQMRFYGNNRNRWPNMMFGLSTKNLRSAADSREQYALGPNVDAPARRGTALCGPAVQKAF